MKAKQKIKALIISDLHLGSPVCQTTRILDVLRSYDFDILFIVGDLFDCLNLKRLKQRHWKVLTKLRKISKKSEVILIRGNHDVLSLDALESLLGIKAYNEYPWEYRGIRYLFVHGDIFDNWISRWSWVTEVFSGLYFLIQRFDPIQQRIARFVKKHSKNVTKCARLVQERAEHHRVHKGADIIICGHTHYPELKEHYANSGCFTDTPCSYLIVQDKESEHPGSIELKHI